MVPKHIAFFIEQAYGHIIPTLGIAAELMRRGHRVSYAVTAEFAPAIARSGARAVVFKPIETRRRLYEYTARPDGSHDFNFADVKFNEVFSELRTQRTEDSLRQLEVLYEEDKPDLIVHDDCLDTAGLELAKKWRVAKVRHLPGMVTFTPQLKLELADELTLISVPKFFNRNVELADDRIVFVGFSAEGRREFFEPWQRGSVNQKTIVASPTTGLLPPVEFCRLIVEAFGLSSWNVILCVSFDLDSVSALGKESLSDLPDNIRLNRHSSNLDVLEHACLFIGQGGQGSTLEAIFSGVPAILLPVAQFHDTMGQRVVELGLGARMPFSTATPERLRSMAESLVADEGTLARVRLAQEAMRADNAAVLGANLIEEELRSSA